MIALSLSEADVKLYPSDASGNAIIGLPVWAGAFAERISVSKKFDTFKYWPTGSNVPSQHQEGEEYTINLGRIWYINSNLQDFQPVPNQRWTMVIRWYDQRKSKWHRRTYKGVYCDSWDYSPNNLVESAINQIFTATQEIQESGSGVYSDIALPSPSSGQYLNEQYLYAFENAINDEDWLLGHYAWPVNVELASVAVSCLAPQSSVIVLTGYIDDTAAVTIEIPTGEVGEVVTATSTYSQLVQAGKVVRWKMSSGPDGEASELALVMRMKAL